MNATAIVSRYGRRIIEWHESTLETLLAELRNERRAHDISVVAESAEAEHNALMGTAEQIKQEATNAIVEASSSERASEQ
jgi:hypothetical protein